MTMKAPSSATIAFVGGRLELRIPFFNRLEQMGFDLILIGEDKEGEIRREGYELIPWTYRRDISPLNDLKSTYRLQRRLQKSNPDILHCFDTKPSVMGCLAGAQLERIRCIRTVNGRGRLFSRNGWQARTLRFIYKLSHRVTNLTADVTVFQNSSDLDYFLEHGLSTKHSSHLVPGSGVDLEKYSPESVPEQSVQKTAQELTESYGIGDEPLVTMLTRLLPEKGVLEFAKAARRIDDRRNNQKASFLIVGPDDRSDSGRSLRRKLAEYEDVVNVAGYRSDVREIFVLSDLFVLPTYYGEGVPRVLHEAAAMKLPLVTTETPGCLSLVENKKNGRLVSPRNTSELTGAIETLLGCTERQRQKMGKTSRQIVEGRYSLSQIAEQYQAIYNDLLGAEEGS